MIDVRVGRDVIKADTRMGMPPDEVLERHWRRAVAQGGDPTFLEAVKDGFTGVVGILGQGDGPTVGLRFDMDALPLRESRSLEHRPAREGFASINDGPLDPAMHACGHDGHTAIGLGVAEVLMDLSDHLQGTVKLIFQPAEEGVRGAKSMVEAGIVDDVDYMLGLHLFSRWDVGAITCGMGGYLATSKFDALFTGEPAHAGASPEGGKNAMLAAATAVLNLYAIPRHRDGATRVNVGRLNAGTGRNVICPDAQLALETRGATTALNDYMYTRATRVLNTAAAMYDCTVALKAMGSAESADSDRELAERVERIAIAMGGFTLRPPENGGGSEDYTYMMKRVQARGGLAINIGLGADLGGWGHHTARFDIDERALKRAVELLSTVTMHLIESS
jgi:aminobenzoyl-glutamate utilization protein A